MIKHKYRIPSEIHKLGRLGWLRAAVLGANDGIISVSSLLAGVAAAHTSHRGLLISGIAALVAGAMSMAAGEYISVSSQADSENAEIQREKMELEKNPRAETQELTAIYIKYGLEATLAKQVASQLMAINPLETHMREELGITHTLRARPLQAAISSALSFSTGGLLPILVIIFTPKNFMHIPVLFVMAIIFLALLGGIAASIGGSKISVGITRATLWGTFAMLITAGVGSLFGTRI